MWLIFLWDFICSILGVYFISMQWGVFAVTMGLWVWEKNIKHSVSFFLCIFVRTHALNELVKMSLGRGYCGNEGISNTRGSCVVVHNEEMEENNDGVRWESFDCKTECTRLNIFPSSGRDPTNVWRIALPILVSLYFLHFIFNLYIHPLFLLLIYWCSYLT